MCFTITHVTTYINSWLLVTEMYQVKKIKLTIYCERGKKTSAVQNYIHNNYGNDYNCTTRNDQINQSNLGCSINKKSPSISWDRELNTCVTSLSLSTLIPQLPIVWYRHAFDQCVSRRHCKNFLLYQCIANDYHNGRLVVLFTEKLFDS